ncbi:MAG TPA: DUF2867 domain-containing protein [Chthoniobacterales bacterium]|nr:DUF2867 domain-containing protein [Chthoniobacterales bacterium]
MPRISTQEFVRLPLRVHDFLTGVPLHDVWAVDLPRTKDGITLNEFLQAASTGRVSLSPAVRLLLHIRFSVGKIFGWDREPAVSARETFVDRMMATDRSSTLVAPGTKEGFFRVVYRFENEQLLEVLNRTAHAAALSALVETPTAYRYYFAVYVKNVGRLTPIYMSLIDPIRRLIVYPSLLRSVQARWDQAFSGRI